MTFFFSDEYANVTLSHWNETKILSDLGPLSDIFYEFKNDCAASFKNIFIKININIDM